jgi:hypothetical protein
MEHSIRLGFRANDGRAINVNVPRANPTVTGAQVRSAMERILDTQIIVTNVGAPETIDSADLITTEEIDYEI